MWILALTKLTLLIVPGGALWVSAQLMSTATDDERSRSGAYVALRWSAKLLLVFGMMGVFISLLNPIGLLLLPILLLCFLSILMFSIRSTRENFSRCIIQAASNRLPLPIVARTLADNAPWLTRRRLDGFASRLEASEPIGSILKAIPLKIPAALQIQMAMDAELPAASDSLQQVILVEEAYQKGVREWVESCLYLLSLSLLLSAVAAFLSWKIAPSFFAIITYMKLDGTSQLLDSIVNNRMALPYYAPIALVNSVIALMVVATYYAEFLPRSWSLFFIGNRRYDDACALMAIATIVKNQGTFLEGMKGITLWHPFSRYRRKGKRGLEMMKLGKSVGSTLNRLGWIDSMSIPSIDRADRHGKLGESLMRIALEKAERSRRGWLWMSRLMVPIGMILLGGIVLVIVGSLFLLMRTAMVQLG